MKITKVIGLLGLCAGLSAFGAEKSGVFAGLEVGVAQTEFKQEIATAQMAMDITAKATMPHINIKGGYKHFYNEFLGVRGYGAIGVGYGKMKDIKLNAPAAMGGTQSLDSIFYAPQQNRTQGYYTTFIDYNVGADVLVNFAEISKNTYGAFAGLALGGVTWIANGKEHEVSNGERSYLNFVASANVGLRATFAQQHGVELGARFYFPKSKIFDASNGTSPLMVGQNISHTETTHSRPWAIFVGYNFSF